MSDIVETGSIQTATQLTAIGTGGVGYLAIVPQSAAPGTSTDTRIYSNLSGQLSWRSAGDQPATIVSTSLTASRSYTLPDASGQVLTDNSISALSNKTAMSGAGNILDATYINAQAVNGPFAAGTVLQNTGSAWAPLTLSATAPLAYSAGNFSATVGSGPSTLAAGNDARFATPQVVIVKINSAGAGEFTSIATALASITDSSAAKPYVVEVGPGVYTEPAMTIPAYVTVAGAGLAATFVQKSSTSGTVFTYSDYCSMRDMAVIGSGSTTAITIDSAINAYLTRIAITGFSSPIIISGSVGVCSVTIVQLSITGTVGTGIFIDGRALTGTNTVAVGLNTAIVNGTATTAIRIEGPYANATLANLGLTGGTTGLLIQDTATVTTTSTRVQSYTTGINVANVGGASTAYFDNVAILNCTVDLAVAHPGATGSFSGLADVTKVVIATTSTFPFDFIDAANQSVTILGDLNYRPATGADTAEIGALLTYAAALGTYTGGQITAGVGKTINVAAGEGYVAHSVYPNQHLVKVIWAGYTSGTLADDTTYYVYADDLGVGTTLSLPNPVTQILLGRIRTTTTGIEFIDPQRVSDYHPANANLDTFRYAIGALYSTGTIVQANGSRQLSITGGQYYYLNNQYNPSGQATPAGFYAYYHSAGVWTRAAATVVDNAQYDDNTNLVAIPAGQFVKHSFYIVGEGTSEQYFLVYGQQTYASQAAAEAGNLPTPPPYFTEGIFRIAALVVQQGVSTVVSILDLRPTLGSSAASFGAVTDHGNLTGLADDDHLQYLLVNGTRAMGGNLAMGGNAVSGATTYNGIVVETHASRHLPNGADPITTAAPLTTLSNVTTNSVGTANSLARSDHTHALDVTTFPINSLSGTLSVAKGGTGVTTLTAGNVLVGNGALPVSTTKAAPSGAFVGTTDFQNLSNKTILDAGSSVTARALWGSSGTTSVSTFSAAGPTPGQVLTALTGGVSATAGWATPGSALVDNTTFIVDATVNTTKLGFDITGSASTTTTLRTVQTANQIAVIPDLAGATDTFIMGNLAQTMTNKTLTAPVIATIVNGGTLTVPSSTDTLIARNTNDTLTNKNITGTTNFVAANSLKTTGADVVVSTALAPTPGQVLTASSATAAAWQTPGMALSDATTFIVDSVNPLIKIGFDAAGSANTTTTIASSQTANRTVTIPDAAGNFVLDTFTQTLTNKTITDAGSTITATGLRFGGTTVTTSGGITNGYVLTSAPGNTAIWQAPGNSLIDNQTFIYDSANLTSRRIGFDVVNGIVDPSVYTLTLSTTINGPNQTLTLPYTTDTLVARNTTDVMTNKNITDAGSTITATGLRNQAGTTVSVIGSTPSAGQVLKATSSTNATWQSVGDVTGPASSTDEAIARYDGTTGKILQNSLIRINDTGSMINMTSLLGATGTTILVPAETASAVNYLTIRNATTGNGPSIETTGADADIPMVFEAKSTILTAYTFMGPQGFTDKAEIQVSEGGGGTTRLYFTPGAGINVVTVPDITGEIAMDSNNMIFTNKSLSDNSCRIVDDLVGSKALMFSVGGNTAGITLTLSTAQTTAQSLAIPNVSAGDTLVTNNTTATILNKTMTDDTNNVRARSVKTSTLGTYVDFSASAPPAAIGQVFYINDAAGSEMGGVWGHLSSLTPFANINTISKKLVFHVSDFAAVNTTTTITVAQTGNRAIAIPNADGVIVLDTASQSLTNKTITDSTNTVTATALRTTGSGQVSVTGTAPTINYVLRATSGTAATWVPLTYLTNPVDSISTSSPITVATLNVTGPIGKYEIQASCIWSVGDTTTFVSMRIGTPAGTTIVQDKRASDTNKPESFMGVIYYTSVAASFSITFSRNTSGTPGSVTMINIALKATPVN